MNVKEAAKFIQQYKDAGHIADVYSADWLKKHPDFPLFSEYELEDYQKASRRKCVGHLHVIHFDNYSPELPTALGTLYKPFQLAFDNAYHKPDLVFVNLLTEQIFCIGLGRKNDFFFYELGKEKVVYREVAVLKALCNANYGKVDETSIEFKKLKRSIEKFTRYDYGRVLEYLVEALAEFGQLACDWDHLPLNSDLIDQILSSPPTGPNGLYEVDGDYMSRFEVEQILEKLELINELGKEHLNTIQWFFPFVEWCDLNTQDY